MDVTLNKLKRCSVCEGFLHVSQFQEHGTICKICAAKLFDSAGVDYSPPVKKSIKMAYIDLIIGIREQAIADGELEDWEAFWMVEPWITIWGIIKKDMEDANFNAQSGRFV